MVHTSPPPSTVPAELDGFAHLIDAGRVDAGLSGLMASLGAARCTLPTGEWKSLTARLRHHPVIDLVHQSPFAKRAFQKPRGYAGDAEMLDLLYRVTDPPPETGRIGRQILECERDTATACAIRERLDVMARAIDDVAFQHPGGQILSLGCGHLREGQRSEALINGDVTTFIAVDQDALSLRRVAAEQPFVTIVHGSVRQILTGGLRWDGLDLIYSAGLYDYLSDRSAAVLTSRLFGMLRNGGQLLVGNMTPQNTGIGYLEGCLDWAGSSRVSLPRWAANA